MITLKKFHLITTVTLILYIDNNDSFKVCVFSIEHRISIIQAFPTAGSDCCCLNWILQAQRASGDGMMAPGLAIWSYLEVERSTILNGKDPTFSTGPFSSSQTVNVYQRVPGKMTSQVISRCPGVTINSLPSSKNSLEVELSIGKIIIELYKWGIFQEAMAHGADCRRVWLKSKHVKTS